MSSVNTKRFRKTTKVIKKMQKLDKKSGRRQRAGLVGPSSTGNRGRGRIGLSDNPRAVTSRRMQTIAEDEYIADVIAGANPALFNTTAYSVNPGQSSVFPWGSKIAALYEEYEFELLEFYYKREVSEFSAAGTTGKVILSFDYDVLDAAPTTKQQVEDSVPHVDGMPCDPMFVLKLDCARFKKNLAKYVRPGAQPANTDLKTYDAGNLYVSTFGLPSSTINVGELRVRYRVRFQEPILEPAQVVSGVVHFSGTTPTTGDNFATSALQSGGTAPLTAITIGSNTVTFPASMPGNYLLALSILGSSSATAPAVSSYTGGLNWMTPNMFTSTTRDAEPDAKSASSASGTICAMLTICVNASSAGGTIVYTPSAISGGIGMDLFIVALPVSVVTVVSEFDRAIDLRVRELEARFALSSMTRNALSTRVEEWESDDNKDEKMDLSTSQSNLASQLVSLLSSKK